MSRTGRSARKARRELGALGFTGAEMDGLTETELAKLSQRLSATDIRTAYLAILGSLALFGASVFNAIVGDQLALASLLAAAVTAATAAWPVRTAFVRWVVHPEKTLGFAARQLIDELAKPQDVRQFTLRARIDHVFQMRASARNAYLREDAVQGLVDAVQSETLEANQVRQFMIRNLRGELLDVERLLARPTTRREAAARRKPDGGSDPTVLAASIGAIAVIFAALISWSAGR